MRHPSVVNAGAVVLALLGSTAVEAAVSRYVATASPDTLALVVDRLAAGGDRIVALATSGRKLWVLAERGDPAMPAVYRVVTSSPREFEQHLNVAAADGFRLGRDLLAAEYKGRYFVVLERQDDPLIPEYRVTLRLLFKGAPLFGLAVREARDPDGEVRKHVADGFTPLGLVDGRAVLVRQPASVPKADVRVLSGRIDHVVEQVTQWSALGFELLAVDADEKHNFVVLLARPPGARPVEARLLAGATALETQALINRSVAEGFGLWQAAVAVHRSGEFLAVMKRTGPEGTAYELAGPLDERVLGELTRDRTPAGFVQGQHTYVALEVPRTEMGIVGSIAPAAGPGHLPAHSFDDLQYLRYDDLGSRVVIAADNRTTTGTLVGIRTNAVSLLVDQHVRTIRREEVRSIRSRTVVKRAVGWGGVIGLGAGLAVDLAWISSSRCAEVTEEGECYLAKAASLFIVPSLFGVAGVGIGFAVGHTLHGPRLYEPSPELVISFQMTPRPRRQ